MGGNVSRAVVQKVKKPIKNYNVHNRAEKVMERHKTDPVVAPKHASTEEKLKKHMEDNPHLKKEVDKKHDNLISRMNSLKLEVTGSNPEIRVINPDRPLPQSSAKYDDPLRLSEKPESVPIRKLSLVQASELLTKHKTSPNEYTAKVIAAEYNLDLDETYCLLQYFYSLDVGDNQLLDLAEEQKVKMRKMLIYSPPVEKKDKETSTKSAES